jgi:predicted ArsR family transcriptional regulator
MSRRKNAEPATLAGKLRKFYAENPLEELSADDVAAKLGITHQAASMQLRLLATRGLLERVSVYRVRPKC